VIALTTLLRNRCGLVGPVWTAYPRFPLSTVAWPVLDRVWNGYARKAFDVLSDELLAPQGIR
jgi:hypothetical protein